MAYHSHSSKLFLIFFVICLSKQVFTASILQDNHEFFRNNDVCDPHTVTTDQYPSILTRLCVVQTSPIKLKAHYRLPNSTKEFTFEGTLYAGSGYTMDVALTACRSLGCSKVSTFSTLSGWKPTETCEFTCPDGSSAKRLCLNMQGGLQCPNDAMSLIECIKQPFWFYSGENNAFYVAQVLCTECGDE